MRIKNAFSLIEIIIAIGIIVLFITLPVLAFSNYSKNSRDQKRKSDVLKVAQALEQYKAEKGTYPTDLTGLVTEGYLPEIPIDPKDGQQIPGEADGLTYHYEYETDGTDFKVIARLESELPGNGGPAVFIVTPTNPGGVEGPIAQLTQEAAANPSPTIPSVTPFLSPTSGIGASVTPVPCNQTIVCTGPCQPIAGRCAPASYASTRSACQYTTRSGSTNCSPAAAPDQNCTISSQSCTGQLVCIGTNCVTPTPTNTPTPTPRYCWATNGVCNTACNNLGVTAVTSHTTYSSCSPATYYSCWNQGGEACTYPNVGDSYESIWSTPSCSGTLIGHLMAYRECADSTTGVCYRASTNFIQYDFTSSGTGSRRVTPNGSCFNFSYQPPGGTSYTTTQTPQQCTFSAAPGCQVASYQPSGAIATKYKWGGSTTCSPTGAGNCYLMNGSPASYTDSGGAGGCGSNQYWNSYTQCQWIQY